MNWSDKSLTGLENLWRFVWNLRHLERLQVDEEILDGISSTSLTWTFVFGGSKNFYSMYEILLYLVSSFLLNLFLHLLFDFFLKIRTLYRIYLGLFLDLGMKLSSSLGNSNRIFISENYWIIKTKNFTVSKLFRKNCEKRENQSFKKLLFLQNTWKSLATFQTKKKNSQRSIKISHHQISLKKT